MSGLGEPSAQYLWRSRRALLDSVTSSHRRTRERIQERLGRSQQFTFGQDIGAKEQVGLCVVVPWQKPGGTAIEPLRFGPLRQFPRR